MRVVVTKDLLSGILFAAIGFATVYISSHYRIGTAVKMGPGFFPTMIGGVVAVIGVAVAVKSWLRPELSATIANWELRPLVFILGGVLAFGLVMTHFGLIPAVVTLVLVSRLAGRQGSALELAVVAATLCVLAVLVFVYGLKMPLDLWSW